MPLHGVAPGPHSIAAWLTFRHGGVGDVCDGGVWRLTSVEATFTSGPPPLSSPPLTLHATVPPQGRARVQCGASVDDSEWCLYSPGCVDASTLALVLDEDGVEGIRGRLGRPDDTAFTPRSYDRPVPLPHRSALLVRAAEAEAEAKAEAAPQRGTPDPPRLPGTLGLFAVDSPENVFHSATKAMQLAHAASELGLTLDAVLPVTCTAASGSR